MPSRVRRHAGRAAGVIATGSVLRSPTPGALAAYLGLTVEEASRNAASTWRRGRRACGPGGGRLRRSRDFERFGMTWSRSGQAGSSSRIENYDPASDGDLRLETHRACRFVQPRSSAPSSAVPAPRYRFARRAGTWSSASATARICWASGHRGHRRPLPPARRATNPGVRRQRGLLCGDRDGSPALRGARLWWSPAEAIRPARRRSSWPAPAARSRGHPQPRPGPQHVALSGPTASWKTLASRYAPARPSPRSTESARSRPSRSKARTENASCRVPAVLVHRSGTRAPAGWRMRSARRWRLRAHRPIPDESDLDER